MNTSSKLHSDWAVTEQDTHTLGVLLAARTFHARKADRTYFSVAAVTKIRRGSFTMYPEDKLNRRFF